MLIDHYPPTVKGFHNIELYGGRINLCLMLGDAQEMFSALGESIDQRNSTYNKKPIDAWFLDGFSRKIHRCGNLSCVKSSPAYLHPKLR